MTVDFSKPFRTRRGDRLWWDSVGRLDSLGGNYCGSLASPTEGTGEWTGDGEFVRMYVSGLAVCGPDLSLDLVNVDVGPQDPEPTHEFLARVRQGGLRRRRYSDDPPRDDLARLCELASAPVVCPETAEGVVLRHRQRWVDFRPGVPHAAEQRDLILDEYDALLAAVCQSATTCLLPMSGAPLDGRDVLVLVDGSWHVASFDPRLVPSEGHGWEPKVYQDGSVCAPSAWAPLPPLSPSTTSPETTSPVVRQGDLGLSCVSLRDDVLGSVYNALGVALVENRLDAVGEDVFGEFAREMVRRGLK